MAWAKKFFRKSLMEGQDGVPSEEPVLILDILLGQTTDEFRAYMKKECNLLVWCYPRGCTDALQAIEAGLGALIKHEVGKQLDLWLEDADNLERWESVSLTATNRRILLTRCVAEAVDIVDNRPGYRFRLFEKTGAVMTADGSGDDDRIKVEGLTERLAFIDDESDDEVDEVGEGSRERKSGQGEDGVSDEDIQGGREGLVMGVEKKRVEQGAWRKRKESRTRTRVTGTRTMRTRTVRTRTMRTMTVKTRTARTRMRIARRKTKAVGMKVPLTTRKTR